MPAKAIFKGQTFALSGKLSQPQKEYEDLIRKHGGDVASSLTTTVTFLLSTEDDVKACSQKVATAQGRGIPILQEGFVGACVAAKKILDPSFFSIRLSGKKRAIAASAVTPPPKAIKLAADAPACIAKDIEVLGKSGISDIAGVVQENVSKGFVKGSLVWDVELVLADPASSKDRFYKMQLLAKRNCSSTTEQTFWAVQQWGKTGMEGRSHVDGPFADIMSAKRIFRKKYRQKTGNVWGQLGASFQVLPGKYQLLVKDGLSEAPGRWQYYVHEPVNGKKIGWYDYDSTGGSSMEKYWRQFKTNNHLAIRTIQGDYAKFQYEVDFGEMIQKNTTTGTRRAIRRVPLGEVPSAAPPKKIPEAAAPMPVVPSGDSSDHDDEEDEEMDDQEEEEEEKAEADENSDGEAAEEKHAKKTATRGFDAGQIS